MNKMNWLMTIAIALLAVLICLIFENPAGAEDSALPSLNDTRYQVCLPRVPGEKLPYVESRHFPKQLLVENQNLVPEISDNCIVLVPEEITANHEGFRKREGSHSIPSSTMDSLRALRFGPAGYYLDPACHVKKPPIEWFTVSPESRFTYPIKGPKDPSFALRWRW